MLIKICYGHGLQKYFMNVTSCTFCSHTAEEPYVVDLEQPTLYLTVWSKEYARDGYGCTRHESSDTAYYMNFLTIKTSDNPEEQHVAFTGVAYLCDDNGKTIDTMR